MATVHEPEPPTQLDRLVRRGLDWLAGGVSTTIRTLLFGIALAVLIGGRTGAVAVGDTVSWIALSTMVLSAFAGIFLLWRSRTRAQSSIVARERDALQEKLDTVGEMRRIESAERAAERDAATRSEEKKAVYRQLERDGLNGLDYALRNADSLPGGIERFVEGNSLEPINEAFAAELGSAGDHVRVETGIAVRVEHGFRVTHASGKYTHQLKSEGSCHTGPRKIEDVLSRKASAHFIRDGWHVIPLEDTEPLHYLFILSSVPIGRDERESLEYHAALVRVTTAIFQRVDLPS
jgi:hypothetical protein